VSVPVASRSKSWVYGRSPAAIVGSNPTGGMDVCLLCVVRQKSLRRGDNTSRGVLPSVARRCVCSRNLVKRGVHSPHWVAEPEKKNQVYRDF
jgi:hypothetical protein